MISANGSRINGAELSKSVVIIQRVISHYRVPFFQRLQRRLGEMGVQLTVIYGQEDPGVSSTAVNLDEEWAKPVHNLYLSWPGGEVVWQPCLLPASRADLVIVEQAGRLLVNYPLLLLRAVKRFRLAFWGHGRNWQSPGRGGVAELIKSRMSCRVDWWFAYTERTAELLRVRGFADERITVVRNTVDTEELARGVSEVSEEDLSRCREGLAVRGDNIVLFCGGMYPSKRLDFLLDACRRIHESLPDFTVIFIGSGSDQHLIEEAERLYPWVRYLGPVVGEARAVYFRMAKAILMPGLVGLAIIDSFAAGVPLVTTNLSIHSPEIAYLEPGTNGIMTTYDPSEFSRAVLDLLASPEQQQALAAACRRSAADFSLDQMVERFAEGICKCLGSS